MAMIEVPPTQPLKRPWFSIDVETTGSPPEYALQPWRVAQGKAWLTTIAMAWRDKEGRMKSRGMILPGHADGSGFEQTQAILRGILAKVKEANGRAVGWNMPFDIGWFLAYGLEKEVYETMWADAMCMWQHLDIEPTFMGVKKRSLDAANKQFEHKYIDYKHDVDYHDPSPAAREKLRLYNISDTEATLLHAERFWSGLNPRQRAVFLTESRTIPRIAASHLEGMYVHVDRMEKLDLALLDMSRRCAEALSPHGVTEKIIRSPARLGTLLFKQWGLPVIKRNDPTAAQLKKAEAGGYTAEGTPVTDKDVLDQLALDDNRTAIIDTWREAINLRTKFVDALATSLDYNGQGNRTHPQPRVFGTYTGRLTYSSTQGRGMSMRQTGFAVHQMKNEARFRTMLIAPPEHDLVEFDAAGQEYRWMAILSGDPVMLEMCMPGGDPHSFMAAQIYGLDYETLKAANKAGDKDAGKKRKGGKVANLSLQYRTFPKRLRIAARVQHNLKLSEDEAKHIWLTYQRTLIGVPKYWKSQIQIGKATGYAENLAGRRVSVEGDWGGDMAWAMESTMINYPIQSTGGDQKYLALSVLNGIMSKYDARFAFDLHDGIFFYVPKDKSHAFASHARKLLDNLPYKKAWDLTPPIPLMWDAKLGEAWGGLKEFEG